MRAAKPAALGVSPIMVETSVLIPAYDVARYVGATLDSLLRQSARDFEVILVDDGSRDQTLAIARDYEQRFAASGRPLRIETGENRGAGAARNKAMSLARGTFWCFVDADDLLHPHALETLALHLREDRSADLVFPQCRHVDPHGQPTGVVSSVSQRRFSAGDLLVDNPVHTGTGVTIRRERAEAAGLFDTSLRACIDVDYWIRVAGGRADNILAIDQVLVDYRTRPGQITADWRAMRRGWEVVAAKALAAGHAQIAALDARAHARNVLIWASMAYKNGEYAASRRLMAECWRIDPAFMAGDRYARLRSAAAVASLLPAPLHRRLRDWSNG